MTHSTTLTAGIDVAKTRLDVAVPGAARTFALANAPEGWTDLIRTFAELGVGRVGLEASGGYERPVAEALRAAGLDVRLLQPAQVRFCARLRLRRANLVDAADLADDPDLRRLADRLTYVEQIEEDIARIKIRREHHRDTHILDYDARDIAELKARRRRELAAMLADLRSRPDLARRLELLVSIPGIGERTALTLVVRMPELGHLDREQVASLAGLAPFDDQSGKRTGARHIAGGRARVRSALFRAAFPAAFRWNPALVELYRRLTARGKPFHLAIIACARKLLVFANAVIHRGTPWRDETLV
jgi:transposase